MAKYFLKNRYMLRSKDLKKLVEGLSNTYGSPVMTEEKKIEMATFGDPSKSYKVIIVCDEIVGFEREDQTVLTIKGIERYSPMKRFITIDMGAVPFIHSGADVMAPGIVDADQDILSGDVVWVRDVKNKKTLAVGVALQSGKEMVQGNRGKACKTIHYVGDELWKYEI